MLNRFKNRIILKLIRWVEKIKIDSIKQSMNNNYDNVSKDFQFDKYFSFLKINDDFRMVIEDGVLFRKYCQVTIHPNAFLEIKKNVFFNNYCSVNCLGTIIIGENTIFGEGVKIYDHNHKYNYDELGSLKIERNNFSIGKISIGKNCWIGSNVTILNNVEIGENVIIGANNLIYKSIPSNSVVKQNTVPVISMGK